MKDLRERFARLGVKIPEILLPREGIDEETWAVIACDQFSSEREYWEEVKEIVGDKPSTLHMIYPECYLSEADKEELVARINTTMREYLDSGIFRNIGPGFVLVDRETSSAPSRKGIILAVDLEQYDFSTGSQSLIRPTEGTILGRLPPRIQIREKAALELPHILFLIDDPDGLVIEKAAEKMDSMEVLYDFDLMKGGGHVTGRKIDDPEILATIAEGLEKLSEGKDLLFAVGDGNHSLATAKSIWENLKDKGGNDVMNHPARWALVEVENIFGEGLRFEPIHRVLFKVNPSEVLEYLKEREDCSVSRQGTQLSGHKIGVVSSAGSAVLTIENGKTPIPAEALQVVLDSYLEDHGTGEIDYIHGEETLMRLGSQPESIGFLLPPQEKRAFFKTIMERGAFPRKTFSIGEAEEKRYYMEAQKIIP